MVLGKGQERWPGRRKAHGLLNQLASVGYRLSAGSPTSLLGPPERLACPEAQGLAGQCSRQLGNCSLIPDSLVAKVQMQQPQAHTY